MECDEDAASSCELEAVVAMLAREAKCRFLSLACLLLLLAKVTVEGSRIG